MKLKPKSKKIKISIIVGLFVVLLAIGGYAAFAFWQDWWPFLKNTSHVDYNTPTEEQREAGERASADVKQSSEPEDPSKPDTGGPNPSPDGQVSVSITAANVNSGKLQVRTLIQSLDPGTCTLTLSREGHSSITHTASTQALASTSTCQGFDVPVNNLPAGEWKVTVDFKNDNQKGQATQNVTIP